MAFPGEERQRYWEGKWERDELGWHRDKVDGRLKNYVGDLTGHRSGVRILVTWCGKSVDIPWLCQEGYDVSGVELSEIAVKQMFEENEIPYSVSDQEGFIVYQATDRKIKMFVGNFYKLTPGIAGTYEAVWDHHALGASEPEDRVTYRGILISLLRPHGRILLSNFEYGDQKRNMAPFSVSKEMVKDLLESHFEIKYLENATEFIDFVKSRFSFDWANHHIHLLTVK